MPQFYQKIAFLAIFYWFTLNGSEGLRGWYNIRTWFMEGFAIGTSSLASLIRRF